MTTRIKVIIIIALTVLGFLIQNYFQTRGELVFNGFLNLYTINPYSGLVSWITNMFLHANLIHIGMNMVMLFLLSTMFSEKSNFFTIYFFSGITASLFSFIYVNFISGALVLGASGAIFGIFSYIFFRTNRRKEFYLNFIIFNVGMIAIGMNIAWYAHLGGAIAGILYYYYENDIIPKIKRKKMKRI